MKTLLSAIVLSVLSVSAVHAEIAIDGKDYETTIPVTMENFDHAETAVNFNKWVNNGIMNSLFPLTDYYQQALRRLSALIETLSTPSASIVSSPVKWTTLK